MTAEVTECRIWIHVSSAECGTFVNQFWLVSSDSVNIASICIRDTCRRNRSDLSDPQILINLHFRSRNNSFMCPVDREWDLFRCRLIIIIYDRCNQRVFSAVIQSSDKVIHCDRDQSLTGLAEGSNRLALISVIVLIVWTIQVIVFCTYNRQNRCASCSSACDGRCDRERCQRLVRYTDLRHCYADRLCNIHTYHFRPCGLQACCCGYSYGQIICRSCRPILFDHGALSFRARCYNIAIDWFVVLIECDQAYLRIILFSISGCAIRPSGYN